MLRIGRSVNRKSNKTHEKAKKTKERWRIERFWLTNRITIGAFSYDWQQKEKNRFEFKKAMLINRNDCGTRELGQTWWKCQFWNKLKRIDGKVSRTDLLIFKNKKRKKNHNQFNTQRQTTDRHTVTHTIKWTNNQNDTQTQHSKEEHANAYKIDLNWKLIDVVDPTAANWSYRNENGRDSKF